MAAMAAMTRPSRPAKTAMRNRAPKMMRVDPMSGWKKTSASGSKMSVRTHRMKVSRGRARSR